MAVQGAWDGGGAEIPSPGWGRGAFRDQLKPRAVSHSPSNCVSLFLRQDYLDALTGICYDGLEGLLYLGLFSLLAALAFSTMICMGPGAWKHFATRWAAWAASWGRRQEAQLCD